MRTYILFFGILIFGLVGCSNQQESPGSTNGPYFGNGFRNGWIDQTSVSIWTRLTDRPDGDMAGAQFLELSKEDHKRLRTSTNVDSLDGTQIPENLELDDMIGACPGAAGEVRLRYYPIEDSTQEKELPWKAVDPDKDFTTQWRLTDLLPNTNYAIQLEARATGSESISDTFEGRIRTAPTAETPENISFCIVTCHDFNRRDDPNNGHQIYPAMAKLNPDFYVHAGDIEYYDKPLPYAMTEAMMRYKWNRYFALPFQRDFFRKTSTYFMKDDHDVLSDDAFPGMTYGTVSYERGLEIFDQEQFPSNDLPYKTIRWGKDLQIWIVEGRNYRSKNSDPDGADKTIWGKTQKAWFYETVEASDATFKILFTSTPILGPDRKQKADNYSNSNFKYEGDEIRAFLNKQSNFFICNGDRHWQYVTQPTGTNLWEFSAGAGADGHAGGWSQEDKRPEHRFLRVKGGFLSGSLTHNGDEVELIFKHHAVDGTVVHEEAFVHK